MRRLFAVLVLLLGVAAPVALGAGSGNDFHTLPPCRVLDTRLPAGPLGGPALQAGVARTFSVTGACGIPAGAGAVSVNATVTNTTAPGYLVLYAADIATPETSNLSFSTRQTRASASIVGVAPDGTLKAVAGGGGADLILDVNGYFAATAAPPTVTLDPVGDQAIPTNTTLSLRLSGHSTDAAAALTYDLLAGPTGASVSPLGVFAFSPKQAQLGVDSATVRVRDGGGRSAQRAFQITITDHDHAPVLGPLPDDLTRVGASYTKILTATDPDAGDVLTFSLLSGPAGMTLSGSTLSWVPTSAQLGNWPVRVKVTDRAGLSASGQFNVGIQFLVATDDAYSVNLGQTLTVNAPGVLANDLDPLAGPLTAAKLTNPDKGTLSAFNSNGGFTYQAPAILPGPVFAPAVKFHVDQLVIGGGFFGPPVVADVNGDGIPDIVVLSGPPGFGVAAIRGTDGFVLWKTPTLPPPYSDCTAGALTGGNGRHLAVGDIDDSGQVSIVFPTSCGRDNQPSGIVGSNASRYVALNGRDGSFKWLSPPLGNARDSNGNPNNYAFGTSPTLARLRSGETPSILVGTDVSSFDFAGKPACDDVVPGWPAGLACRAVFVLDGVDGKVRQRMAAPTLGGGYPRDLALPGGTQVANAADLDGDGSVEVIFGGGVWNNDGSVRSNITDANSKRQWIYWTGLGNFDDTPDIEVVRLDSGGFERMNVSVTKSDGSLLWSVPVQGAVGTPAVADVDGSGRPAVVFNADAIVCAVDYRGTYKWCHDTGPTGIVPGAGLQVFDFDGDGIPEVVMPIQGERFLFLDGATGNVKFNFDMSNNPPLGPRDASYTAGPVVADVDGSGHAAILQTWSGPLTGRLNVVGSANNDWRPARKIFNQESYQFGNINDDGTVPKKFVNNFAVPATNVFRNPGQVLTPVDPRKRSQTSFTYAASDGALTSSPGTVRIEILPANRPPVFVSKPPTRYVAHSSSFTYAAQAVDPDPGDTLTYSIQATFGDSASACTIGAGSGVLGCTYLNTGDQSIVIVATDSQGAAAYQTVSLHESSGPGTVPNVVGQTQVAAKTTLTGAGFGVGDITKIDSPQPAGEVLQQTPGAGTSALLGSLVDLVVSNGPAAPPPPLGPPPGLGNIKRIVVTPASTLHVAGDNVPYKATSINNDGTGADITAFVTWSSTATAVATVNAAGVAHAAGAGTTTLTATAGGLSGQASLSVATRANGDSTPPVAIVTQPASGGTVTGLTQILGTATDASFVRYELSLQASGDSTFTLIGQGTSPVTNGVLGTLDPTLLLNGAYTLRLTVFDANGNTAAADVPFVADGNQKVGNFTLAYTDLTVALSGIPIQITRTYDSRDKHAGDFGVGWSLGIKALRVSTSAVLGTAWQVIKQGSTFALVPGTDHFVSVTLANGKVETFDLRISPTTSPFVPFTTLFATFVPRPGTLGRIQSLENVNLLIIDPQPGPVTLVDDTSLNTFHPDRFLYTQRDGTQFVVTRTKGVESVKDTNGNQITITPGGISHSSGAAIAFTRDGSGRITLITDPLGHSRSYAYGPTGDLLSTTDRAGSTTKYFYDAQHGLVRIEDPLGRPASRADYDDQGRLISITDAAGHTATYSHDLPGRQEQVEDALGRITMFHYDDRGNVLSTTDPLGNTTVETWDDRDNLLSFTNALGGTTSTSYDAQNNVISVTDALGRTVTFTRDAGGRPLTMTNPRGFTTTSSYDVSGNQVGMTDALGNAVSYGHDGAGNLTSLTNAAGATTQNAYDALGRRTQLTNPLGAVWTLQYDGNGNLVSQQGPLGPPSGRGYDAENRIVGSSLGALQRTFAYDAAGQLSTITTAAGQPMPMTFDPAGRLATIGNSSGNALVQQTYDAAGNPLTATDALGNTTTKTYDGADRLTSTRLPDGSMETRAYDAAGRLTQATDALGHTTALGYDAAGQLISSTDALGGVTLFQYDANGNKTAQTDPAGRTTQFAYDALDRLIVTTFADGTTESRAYDAEGRLTQLTDPAGHVNSYSYDAIGDLLSVTDPLGHITQHAYQDGVQTATTDANGNTTHFAYDSSGRSMGTTYPLGDSKTATYDAVGNPLSRTNGAGETVQFQNDALGRPIATVLPGGATETYTYTPDQLLGSVSNSSGTTRLDYDPRTRRLVRVTEPDGRYVRYAYDAVGNKTLVAHGLGLNEIVTQYAYDSLKRLVQITDPSAAITVQTWDAAGNLSTVTRPNGVKTTTTYDTRNRPITIVSRDSGNTLLQQHSYTLDALGNRTRVDAFDGSHVDYQYDALSRIVRERHFDASAVLQLDLVYGYDPAGNLVSAGPAVSPLSFTFNADNELVSGGGVTYAYDLAGRRTQESFSLGGPTLFRNYAWDARDRLASFRDTSGATTTYTYDSDGTRLSKGGATGPVTFIVDRASETGFSQLLRETSLSGTNSFVWGTGLLETDEAGTPRFHLFDGLGSTRFLTGSAGTVTDTFNYKAYGELLAHVGASGARHRFAGEETDLESGLTYLRARYYDPRTGGFLSRDPLQGDPSDPQSLHPYLYAVGNPVNRRDPSGRQSLSETLIASYEQVKIGAQRTLQARRALYQAKNVVVETIRVEGGLMAIQAVLESVGNPWRVNRWFFSGRLQQGFSAVQLAFNGTGAGFLAATGAAAGEAVNLVAQLALAKIAFDMLNPRTVVDIQVYGLGLITSTGASVTAAAVRPASELTKGCSSNSNAFAYAHRAGGPGVPALIEICPKFFTLTPVPTIRSLTEVNYSSMPGVMVHEFAHISVRAKDAEYSCKKGTALALIPGAALINADNYRCFAEDGALGGPNIP